MHAFKLFTRKIKEIETENYPLWLFLCFDWSFLKTKEHKSFLKTKEQKRAFGSKIKSVR